MRWRVALAPRHRRKSPRARLLPACMLPRAFAIVEPMFVKTKTSLGAVGALRLVANQVSMFEQKCAARAYAGRPWCPVSHFLFCSNDWRSKKAVPSPRCLARQGGGLGEIFDGAAERGRPPNDTMFVSGTARVSTASKRSPSPTTKATNSSQHSEYASRKSETTHYDLSRCYFGI